MSSRIGATLYHVVHAPCMRRDLRRAALKTGETRNGGGGDLLGRPVGGRIAACVGSARLAACVGSARLATGGGGRGGPVDPGYVLFLLVSSALCLLGYGDHREGVPDAAGRHGLVVVGLV